MICHLLFDESEVPPLPIEYLFCRMLNWYSADICATKNAMLCFLICANKVGFSVHRQHRTLVLASATIRLNKRKETKIMLLNKKRKELCYSLSNEMTCDLEILRTST